MGMKTIRVEIKYASESDSDPAMRQVARECARTLMASAMMIAGGRKPMIAITSEDAFEGEEEIKLFADGEEDGQ